LITKYGYDTLAVVLLVVVAGSVLSWTFIEPRALKLGVVAVFLLALLFTLNFFRDPERETPVGDGLVISPADGKVVLVQDVREEEFLKGGAVQVSIFMSPLDVHVNRYPISGTVAFFRHIPGEYLVAFDEKSSSRNERTLIGVEQGSRRVLFKQIAGFVARRIVAPVAVGDRAVAGERFGMIKFGSRVDVLLPAGTPVKVKVGDVTAAGETILAVLP
jgi:phosphatidylserine decarboxylase